MFDHILLVPICTLCSTCRELNESLLYVQVFQDTSVYDASVSQLPELGVSEFCLCPKLTFKSRVCLRVLSRNNQRGRL